VPINLGWRPDEVAYVLDHSSARGLAVETQLVAGLQQAIGKVAGIAEVIVLPGLTAPYEPEPAERNWTTFADLEATSHASEPECVVDDRDALSYLYTSGTTSFPKGVVGTHLGIYLESMSAALDSGLNAADRFAAMMPMFHTAQLNAFCTPAIMVGATTYILRGFDPQAWLDLIEREQITQVFGLPMMFRAALDHPTFGRSRSVQPSPGRVRDGADARRADPPLPGPVRLRLRAAVRADGNGAVCHAVPARAPAHPHRGGRHAAHRGAGRHHGPPGQDGAAGGAGRDRLPRAVHDAGLPQQP
jgi:acyl-CoA synthetase (AMP-forming)/AMP-acid ligase II